MGGREIARSQGKAWRGTHAWLGESPRRTSAVPVPAVSESTLAWTASGEVEFKEHKANGP